MTFLFRRGGFGHCRSRAGHKGEATVGHKSRKGFGHWRVKGVDIKEEEGLDREREGLAIRSGRG